MIKKFLSFIFIFSFLLSFFPIKTFATQFKENFLNSSGFFGGTPVSVGDYLLLGSYSDQPILWRCVAQDENGLLILSDKILTIKAFDAKGNSDYHLVSQSPSFNTIRERYGSNCWSDSNLRQWLNSTEEDISWSHVSPSADGMKRGYNSYDKEPGFLSDSNFSKSELSCIKSVTQKIYVNEAEQARGLADGGKKEYTLGSKDGYSFFDSINYDTTNCYYQNVTDQIFILGMHQLKAVYDNFDNGSYIIAYPTEQAVSQSDYKDERLSASQPWYYWTSKPGTDGASYEHEVIVSPKGHMVVGLDGAGEGTCSDVIGVRPAFYLSDEAMAVYGKGTEENPYIVRQAEDANDLPFSDVDNEIFQKVKLYTSDQGSKYLERLRDLHNSLEASGASPEEYVQVINEFFTMEGFTDAEEGITYISDASSAAKAFAFLTDDHAFLSYYYSEYLNTTTKGKVARGLLLTSDWIFNNALEDAINPSTYITNETTSIKNYKVMLLDFINCASEEYSLKSEKEFTLNLLDILGATSEIGDQEFRKKYEKQIDDAATDEEVKKIIRDLWDKATSSSSNGKLIINTSSFEKNSALFSNMKENMNLVFTAYEDFIDLAKAEMTASTLLKYQDFLQTIADSEDVLPYGLVVAARQLLEEAIDPYTNLFFSFTGQMADMVTDKKMLEINQFLKNASVNETLIKKYPILQIYSKIPLGDALTTIKLSAICVNSITNIGALVKESSYVEAYAYLGMRYQILLKESKKKFLEDPTIENAREFYNCYQLLYYIRVKGEQAYAKMSQNGGIFQIFDSCGISVFSTQEKIDTVNHTLSYLDKNCKFTLNTTEPSQETGIKIYYLQKILVACPVDVSLYDEQGNFIFTIEDGKKFDVTNEYGRFISRYRPFTGDYVKAFYLNTTSPYKLVATGTDNGIMNVKTSRSDGNADVSLLQSNWIPIQNGTTVSLDFNSHLYTVDQDGDGTSEIKEDLLEFFPENDIPVESIQLTKNSLDLKIGEQAVLGVDFSPYNATQNSLIWESSQPSVVSVKNGVLTAQKSGEAVITVSSGVYAVAQCVVKVDDSSVSSAIPVTITPVNGNGMIKQSLSQSPFDLSKFFVFDTNCDSITYSILSQTGTASLSPDGLLTVTQPGEFLIQVQSAAHSGFAAGKARLTLNVTEDEADPIPSDPPAEEEPGKTEGHSSSSGEGNYGYPISSNTENGPNYSHNESSSSSEESGSKTFLSDTTQNITVFSTYQFRITSLNATQPFMTTNNENFRVELASQQGNDYFFRIQARFFQKLMFI